MRTHLPRVLFALVLGVWLSVGLPLSGLAHSGLVSSDPKDGAHLDAMPSTVTLVFNEAIDPNFAQAVVADSENVARPSTPSVSQATMTIPVPDGVHDGKVEVRYRIVSADGHPVAGTVTFTVGSASPTTAAADATTHAPRPAQVEEEDMSTTWMYVMTGLAAALVLGVILAIVVMTRRRSR